MCFKKISCKHLWPFNLYMLLVLNLYLYVLLRKLKREQIETWESRMKICCSCLNNALLRYWYWPGVAPLRHWAVHLAPPPCVFLSDRNSTRRPILECLPVSVTGSGPFIHATVTKHKISTYHTIETFLLNWPLPAENEYVTPTASYGVCGMKIETRAGKPYPCCTFFVRFINHSTLGFGGVSKKICVTG